MKIRNLIAALGLMLGLIVPASVAAEAVTASAPAASAACSYTIDTFHGYKSSTRQHYVQGWTPSSSCWKYHKVGIKCTRAGSYTTRQSGWEPRGFIVSRSCPSDWSYVSHWHTVSN